MLFHRLRELDERGNTIQVGLIAAGTFGTQIVTQMSHAPIGDPHTAANRKGAIGGQHHDLGRSTAGGNVTAQQHQAGQQEST